jgi:sugar lactone lactonase YvrE
MKMNRRLVIIISLLLLVGCAGGEQVTPTTSIPKDSLSPSATFQPSYTSTTTTEPLADTPIPATDTPDLRTATAEETTSEVKSQGFLLEDVGFETPESVLYDPVVDVYLVANINGSPSAKDGNGFIARISPAGEVIALKWIDGGADNETPFTLNAPKGMALSGDRLFVSDIDVVRMFDRETGVWLDDIPVDGARFLNDVAAAEDGTVYVSDSRTDMVHRITPDGSVEQAAQVENPNGIDIRGETILVIGESDRIFRLGDDGALAPAYKAPSGGLDGLVLLEDGSILVSSWGGSAVFRIDADGQASELFNGINAPADIGFDSLRQFVLIPHFEDNRVEARPLP